MDSIVQQGGIPVPMQVVALADSSGNIVSGNPAAVKTGQVVIAVTGTPVRLSVASIPLANGLIVKSKSTNNVAGQTAGPAGLTNAVDGTGNGYILDPGEAASFGVKDVNAVYVNGTANDIFSWEGS